MRKRFFAVGPSPAPPVVDQKPAASEGGAHKDAILTSTGEAAGRGTAEPRFALLIGNSLYTHSALVNPTKDVVLLADVLESLGFDVTVLKDVDLSTFRTAVADFNARLEEAGASAIALFYFAGHGLQDGGVNFLLPIDIAAPTRADLRARSLALDEIVDHLARAPRKANVIVVDACRSPPSDVLSGVQDMTQGLAALQLPPDGMLVVYSTAAGAVAEDGVADCSPYAEALYQALPGVLTPDRRLHDVFVEASERVRKTTDGRQNPALYLQGALPPLEVSDADRERFKNRVFRRPKSWRERSFQWIGVGAVSIVLTLVAVGWWSAYPETRGAILHRMHLSKSAMFDFSCNGSTVADRFNLTRVDWCSKHATELVPLVKRAGLWDSNVIGRLDFGDPGAMTLRAAELSSRNPKGGAAEERELLTLATRAANAGWLPAWAILHRHYRVDGFSSQLLSARDLERGLVRGASASVMSAWIEYGRFVWWAGDTKGSSNVLIKADAVDSTGAAANALGQLWLTGSPAARVAPDLAEAERWLKRACMKGSGEALDTLRSAKHGRLSHQEESDCVSRIIESGSQYAGFWRAQRIIQSGGENMFEAAAAAYRESAEAGYVPAMRALANLHSESRLGARSAATDALYWLGRAAQVGDSNARLMLALHHAWGMPDAEGKPRIPIAAQLARKLYQEAIAEGDAAAALLLANLYEVGAFGPRDLAAARSLATKAIASGNSSDIQLKALKELLARLDYEAILTSTSPELIEAGRRSAKIRVILLMPWGCKTCINQWQVLAAPLLDFIRQGHITLAFRPVYRPDDGERALEAHGVLACAPMERRLLLLHDLLASFGSWAYLPQPDKHKRLLENAAPYLEGRPCQLDPAAPDRLRKLALAQAKQWGVERDILVAVNGARLTAPTADAVLQAIYNQAEPEVRAKLKKP